MICNTTYRPPSQVPLSVQRPTLAEVDLGAIARNVSLIRSRLGSDKHLMAVVKADAYGHGAVAVGKAALASGADWLGVALPEEGHALRREGIQAPILVMGPTLPHQAPLILDESLVATISGWRLAGALEECASSHGSKARVHVKVDTGMGRLGVPFEEAPDFILRITREMPHLEVDGLCTHFATAHQPNSDFALEQLERFSWVCDKVEAMGVNISIRHAANSAAFWNLPCSHLDMIRPGIMIYGCSPDPKYLDVDDLQLEPAMTFKTRIAALKKLSKGQSVSYGRTYVAENPMDVAVLPVGYADGMPRALSNRGEVLVRGRRAPVVGVVCMDATMVDVTHLQDVSVGEEVILFGKAQSGRLPVEEFSNRSGTIPYEVLCRVGSRVPRVYIDPQGVLR